MLENQWCSCLSDNVRRFFSGITVGCVLSGDEKCPDTTSVMPGHPFFMFKWCGVYSTTLNSSFPTPHRGHTQSDGMSLKSVPGSMPFSGSPIAGSYSHPHTSHTYFFITVVIFLLFL